MALERKKQCLKRTLFNETRQYNIQILIKIDFPSKGQDKSKEQEGNVLNNDTLNTFYLRLYGVRETRLQKQISKLCILIAMAASICH